MIHDSLLSWGGGIGGMVVVYSGDKWGWKKLQGNPAIRSLGYLRFPNLIKGGEGLFFRNLRSLGYLRFPNLHGATLLAIVPMPLAIARLMSKE